MWIRLSLRLVHKSGAGHPVVGDEYHQEFYEGEAEDQAEVVGANVSVTLGDGTTYSCLKTREFTPLTPDVNEFKYYAPDVGLVLEEGPDGERIELISVTP